MSGLLICNEPSLNQFNAEYQGISLTLLGGLLPKYHQQLLKKNKDERPNGIYKYLIIKNTIYNVTFNIQYIINKL